MGLASGEPQRKETMSDYIELWFWEIRDPMTGRWRKTTWRMTESVALARHGADARKIEGTREERSVDISANSTSSFLRRRL